MKEKLFDSAFLQKLEYFTLVSRRLHRGESRGEHRTFRKGTSLDFIDYRMYQPGDDFRYIDWNIYGRLGKLLVKLFSAEEDLTLYLLLDKSESMCFGSPRKIDYARRIAAALGFIGIANMERVGITEFSSELGQSLAPLRSRKHLFSLFDFFLKVRIAGGTNLNRSLADFALRTHRPGLAIIISDLLDPEGVELGLKALLYRKFDVILIQILDEGEIAPRIHGALRLEDSESGDTERVTVDSELLQIYRKKVIEYFRWIEIFCLDREIEYLRTTTQVPFEDLILKYLRRGIHLR